MIVKPGDAARFETKDTLNRHFITNFFERGSEKDGDTYYLRPRIIFTTVSTNGDEKKVEYDLEHFTYHHLSTNWSKDSTTNKIKWKILIIDGSLVTGMTNARLSSLRFLLL